jgi:hypothetical protein
VTLCSVVCPQWVCFSPINTGAFGSEFERALHYWCPAWVLCYKTAQAKNWRDDLAALQQNLWWSGPSLLCSFFYTRWFVKFCREDEEPHFPFHVTIWPLKSMSSTQVRYNLSNSDRSTRGWIMDDSPLARSLGRFSSKRKTLTVPQFFIKKKQLPPTRKSPYSGFVCCWRCARVF